MSKAPDRFSDGFQIIIGDKVDFDSEAEAYNAPSKVGQKFTPKEKPKSQDDPKDKGT